MGFLNKTIHATRTLTKNQNLNNIFKNFNFFSYVIIIFEELIQLMCFLLVQ